MKPIILISLLTFLFTLGLESKDLQVRLDQNRQITLHVVKDESLGNIKRSVDVRIDERLSDTDLESVAESVREMNRRKVQRTFIMFYLPDMEINSGAWATAIYDPDLKIRILGTTLEEYESLRASDSSDSDHEIVGVWLDDRPYVGRKIELLYSDGGYTLHSVFKDGSEMAEEMEVTKLGERKKLASRSESSTGEYYVIGTDGQLEFWDAHGRYYTAKKLD